MRNIFLPIIIIFGFLFNSCSDDKEKDADPKQVASGKNVEGLKRIQPVYTSAIANFIMTIIIF